MQTCDLCGANFHKRETAYWHFRNHGLPHQDAFDKAGTLDFGSSRETPYHARKLADGVWVADRVAGGGVRRLGEFHSEGAARGAARAANKGVGL